MTISEPLVLTIEPPYIGSAFSPEVDIDETSSDVTVTITDSRGEHSYTIEKPAFDETTATIDGNVGTPNVDVTASGSVGSRDLAFAFHNLKGQPAGFGNVTATIDDQIGTPSVDVSTSGDATALNIAFAFHNLKGDATEAIADAEAAASAANDAATNANTKAGLANDAATLANSKAGLADEAATLANAKAGLANDAATNANDKATLANNAATSANNAASNANNKATLADNAATNANNKATLANDAATLANTKAGLADEAATAANTAAAAAAAAVDDLAGVVVRIADNLTGNDTDESSWLYRQAPATGSGAEVQSIKGRTLVWNQLIGDSNIYTSSYNGVSYAKSEHKSVVTGTFISTTSNRAVVASVDSLTTGHKFLIMAAGFVAGSTNNGALVLLDNYTQITATEKAVIRTLSGTSVRFATQVANTSLTYDMTFTPMVFDLTAMFGAGNEPATVAEFEALYPNSYYAYDAGTLLPVNLEGIKTVGFNQWDEQWESGIINASGGKSDGADSIRSKNQIEVFSSTTYCIARPSGKTTRLAEYQSDGTFIVRTSLSTTGAYATFTTSANTRYIMFCLGDSNSPERTYANNICLNISDPTRNGEYEPYWTSTLEIPAATYFPDGMRSAGSVYDELTKDSAVTRIGAVDLGTLEWSWQSTWKTWFTGYYTNLKGTDISSVKANIICDNYPTLTQSTMQDGVLDEVGIGAVGSPSNGWRFCAKTASDTVKPSGIAYYEFITPTTTPIDPPLNLAYKVERGGTEQIIVPTGEMSAPPTMAIVYALDADGMRDESLSVIAAIENGKASTNYAVGSYLIHDGKLYKVTSAIASGESITPGTNCTQTTVMAELLALTA